MNASPPAARTVETSAGPVRVRTWENDGPTVLLVHGLLVDGRLWDAVAPLLSAEGLSVVAPDLPLGAHGGPMLPDADLSPHGIARLVDELATTLGLHDVTLVGNDTGGAICQLVAAQRPSWLGGLVLTPCDAYENFLPKLFRPLQLLARRAPALLVAVMQPMRVQALRRTPLLFGWLTKRGVSDDLADAWVRPFFDDPNARRDLLKTLAAIDSADTIAAAAELRSFDRPALVIHAGEDRFFPLRYAERLVADIPGARLASIDDSYAFTPIDQPERTAELIAGFTRGGAASGPAAGVPFRG